MGRTVIKSGKSVNDAIAAALDELNLTIDDVHVDVLDEGKAGFFGLLNAKQAKVKVSELEEDERLPQPEYAGAAYADGSGGPLRGDGENGGDDLDVGGEFDGDADADGYQADGPDDAEYAEADDDGGEGGDAGEDAYDGADGDAYDDGYDETDEDGADGAEAYISAADRDIKRAKDYLYKILNGIHVKAKINASATDEGYLINIESEDSGILIGHRGETLDAIQYLLNLYMNKGRDGFIRITVDVERYKRKREATLKRLAEQMADKVVRLRRNFTLDPMNSYERRIVHSALQNHPRVETYSVGEDPNRRVVVTLKSKGGYSSR